MSAHMCMNNSDAPCMYSRAIGRLRLVCIHQAKLAISSIVEVPLRQRHHPPPQPGPLDDESGERRLGHVGGATAKGIAVFNAFPSCFCFQSSCSERRARQEPELTLRSWHYHCLSCVLRASTSPLCGKLAKLVASDFFPAILHSHQPPAPMNDRITIHYTDSEVTALVEPASNPPLANGVGANDDPYKAAPAAGSTESEALAIGGIGNSDRKNKQDTAT